MEGDVEVESVPVVARKGDRGPIGRCDGFLDLDLDLGFWLRRFPAYRRQLASADVD